MNDEDESFEQKLGKMSLDQLFVYRKAVNIMGLGVNALGVVVCVLMVSYAGLFMIIAGALSLIPLANLSISFKALKQVINQRIEKLEH